MVLHTLPLSMFKRDNTFSMWIQHIEFFLFFAEIELTIWAVLGHLERSYFSGNDFLLFET